MYFLLFPFLFGSSCNNVASWAWAFFHSHPIPFRRPHLRRIWLFAFAFAWQDCMKTAYSIIKQFYLSDVIITIQTRLDTGRECAVLTCPFDSDDQ
ncbi:hypothetical protein F5X98DRAFT_169466 [Xylaria grammica]|nr:hypothetical protein F5X98DRAFT_169466 [Xylaria grammica]